MKTLILSSFVALATSHAVNATEMVPPMPIDHKNLRQRIAKSAKGKTGKSTTRVQVCHKTDDYDCGWKDLEFDDNGLPGHLGHGDYNGTCADTLCDDQDLCTIEHFDETNCCTHDPIVCPLGEICDSTMGCFDPQGHCDDGKKLCAL